MNMHTPNTVIERFARYVDTLFFFLQLLPWFRACFVGCMIHFVSRNIYFSLDHSLGAAHAVAQ